MSRLFDTYTGTTHLANDQSTICSFSSPAYPSYPDAYQIHDGTMQQSNHPTGISSNFHDPLHTPHADAFPPQSQSGASSDMFQSSSRARMLGPSTFLLTPSPTCGIASAGSSSPHTSFLTPMTAKDQPRPKTTTETTPTLDSTTGPNNSQGTMTDHEDLCWLYSRLNDSPWRPKPSFEPSSASAGPHGLNAALQPSANHSSTACGFVAPDMSSPDLYIPKCACTGCVYHGKCYKTDSR